MNVPGGISIELLGNVIIILEIFRSGLMHRYLSVIVGIFFIDNYLYKHF